MDAGRWGVKYALRALAICAVAVLSVAGAVGCGSDNKGTSTAKVPTSIGKGEGTLNLIAWEGYTQPDWVKPFEAQSGCKVHAKFAGSSDEMVTLMRSGGGGQYDMVSASGDASLRLIKG
ncbi:MAG: putative spermidine/putrescine transport system substrate-binding protein, partial [Thermoleophilaceae bacterium]|nr:putative spermidine/putrescine transport system substrate-binding protein [Thermoleophilaceae bacterium]